MVDQSLMLLEKRQVVERTVGTTQDSLLVALRAAEAAVAKENGRFFPYKLYLKIITFVKSLSRPQSQKLYRTI